MNIQHARVALVVVMAAAVLPGRAGADQDIISLPRLIEGSTHIVIGTCRQVQRSPASGLVVTVEVEQQLLGTMPATIVLQANATETEGPDCGVGVRKLLFLRPRRPLSTGAATQQAAALEPVERGAGVIEIAHDGAVEATVTLVRRALDARSASRLTTFRDLLVRSDAPPPRPLVAALLEGRGVVAASDRAFLVDLVCDSANTYLRAAELWAIAEAGIQRVAGARGCLEALAAAGADGAKRLAAVEALGDLGDIRSGPVLLPLLDTGIGGSSGTSSRRDQDLTMGAALALGKIREPRAVRALAALARADADLALHSTVVHALGLVGGPEARDALIQIGTNHAHPLVRVQAHETRSTLDRQPIRRNP